MNAGSGSAAFSQLAKDLHRMPAATRRQMKKAIASASQPMLADAQRRAGWSSRIPGAITVRVATTGGDSIGVQLRVSAATAPHGRPYEGLGGGGQFRHPVYGHRDNWVSQKTRPYAWPAVQAAADKVIPAIGEAAEAAARECGFR